MGMASGGCRNSRQNVRQKTATGSLGSCLAMNIAATSRTPAIPSTASSKMTSHSSALTPALPDGGEDRMNEPPAQRVGDQGEQEVVRDVADHLYNQPSGVR